MNLEEIRGKPDGELKAALDSAREALWKMRFQGATEPIDNPGKIRETRKEIARIESELRARELKTVREKMHAELATPKSTRELAKSLFGGSIERARNEALRLVRKGEVKAARRGAPVVKGRKAKKAAASCYTHTRNLGAKVWALKSAAAAGGKK